MVCELCDESILSNQRNHPSVACNHNSGNLVIETKFFDGDEHLATGYVRVYYDDDDDDDDDGDGDGDGN